MASGSKLNSILLLVAIVLGASSLVVLLLLYGTSSQSPDADIVTDAKRLAGELADNNLPDAAIEEYLKILDRAVLDNAERGAVNYLIGKIYFEDIGDYERAAAYYIRARSLDAKASYAIEAGKNLITCLEKMGRRLDARRELDRQTSPNPEASRPAGKLVAKIGGRDITLAEFNEAFQTLPPQMQDEFAGQAGRRKFLDQVIGRELIYHAALREGFDADSRVQKDLKNLEKDYLIQFYTQQKIAPTVRPDTAELNLYYQANKERYGDKAFAEIEEQVRQEYMQYVGGKAVNDYISTLMQAEPVQVFEENLK